MTHPRYPLPVDNREDGGRIVRSLWIEFKKRDPNAKEHHLYEWDDPRFPKEEREADRFIWEHITTPYIDIIHQLREQRDEAQRDLDQARETLFTLGYELSGQKLQGKGDNHAETA